MLDIYFSLSWEMQLIPFNQSPTGCSQNRGIWDIAVMNQLLFSECAMSCSRADTDGNAISIQRRKVRNPPPGHKTEHPIVSFTEVLAFTSPLFLYLTNVLQMLDVVSFCAYDLIDNVGPHLVFGGLPHPKAPGATAGVVVFATLHLYRVIFHGFILVHSELDRTHNTLPFTLLHTAHPEKGELTECWTRIELGRE